MSETQRKGKTMTQGTIDRLHAAPGTPAPTAPARRAYVPDNLNPHNIVQTMRNVGFAIPTKLANVKPIGTAMS